jgi:hypothetical protein
MPPAFRGRLRLKQMTRSALDIVRRPKTMPIHELERPHAPLKDRLRQSRRSRQRRQKASGVKRPRVISSVISSLAAFRGDPDTKFTGP